MTKAMTDADIPCVGPFGHSELVIGSGIRDLEFGLAVWVHIDSTDRRFYIPSHG
jgi:hypothetical protein